MKRLTLAQIQRRLNKIMIKKKLIDEEIDFETNNFIDVMLILFTTLRLLDYKTYYKGYRRSAIDLRTLYTLIEKWIKFEKKKILKTRKMYQILKKS